MSKAARVAFVAWVVAVAGCGGTDEGPRSSLTAAQALLARRACQFAAGAPPGVSQAKDARLGGEIPIDTLVIVMMENRSFDHLLQNLPAYGQPAAEVAPPGSSNRDSDGSVVPQFHLTSYCFDDTSHGWTDVHTEWAMGAMSGFVVANNHNDAAPADGKRAMGYYTEADLPWLYAAATTFALADHNFSALLGPTFPNREYLYAGTSFGHIGNDIFGDERATVFGELEAAHVEWRIYYTDLMGGFIFAGALAGYYDHTDLVGKFFDDAAAGTLARVNFVDPLLGASRAYDRNDFHPPGDVQEGQKFLADVARAVMHSPQWPHAALIITFDEHGGIYDHVPPPSACPPDGLLPITNPSDNAPGDFDRYGVRVPLLVISPYARPHYVGHSVYDHTSITRFIETRFGLRALTARDANADPLTDLFDFQRPAFATPPSLPDPPLDPAQLDACRLLYPDDMGTQDGGEF